MDILARILERKRAEIARRQARAACWSSHAAAARGSDIDRGALACAALRRDSGSLPRVIAEVKFRSPSAGKIRHRRPGDVARIAHGYVEAGASAVSVLCDGPGFGGSPLDLRRVARVSAIPLLFKEFVLNSVQLDVAQAMGAHMVLLLVRALEPSELREMVDECLSRRLAPVVEAADERELDIALQTKATIIGVNARDLRTFRVSPIAATRCVNSIPRDRIAVYMSGISEPADVERVAESRADAALIGESLMRSLRPGERLSELLS